MSHRLLISTQTSKTITKGTLICNAMIGAVAAAKVAEERRFSLQKKYSKSITKNATPDQLNTPRR